MLILVASILVFGTLVLYWLRVDLLASRRYHVWPLALLPLILVTLVLLQHSDDGLRMHTPPVFVAIAADVSLSMGTLPEPREHSAVGTRLQRARRALLPLLTELETTPRPVMVGVTAFTSKAETILAWDDNLPQVREAIDHVLTPGLLTESGSDLGVALRGAGRLFEMLPVDYQGSDADKYVVLVSDGEQNVERADVAAAIEGLREQGVRIVALHVGLDKAPEGLPVYDADGGFVGFDQVGGQIFSVPDPEVMRMIAGSDQDQGLFVKAEDSGAADSMGDFIGVRTSGSPAGSRRMLLLVVLWCLTTAAMLRYV